MISVDPVQFEKYDPNKKYSRHRMAYKEGGIHNSLVKSPLVTSVFTNLLKQISGKIIKGEIKNMMALSKPVKLCSHLTIPEIIALDNKPTHFLDMAAHYTEQRDPVKRLHSLVAAVVSSIYVVPSEIYTKVPLDPTNLGETCQLIKKQSQTFFYSEVAQLNPPIVLTLMHSKDKSWILKQKHSLQGQIDLPKMNSMTASAVGSKTYMFKESDGTYTEIDVENMQMKIEGILVGERLSRPTGQLKITDKKNGLVCELDFTYTKKSTMSKLGNKLGGLFSKKEVTEQKPIEWFDVAIYKVNSFDPKVIGSEDYVKCKVSEGFGNYVEFYQFDGKIMWKQEEEFENWEFQDSKYLLKSDVSLKDCRTLVSIEDYDNAEKEKVSQEKLEKADIILRTKAREQSMQRGFKVLNTKF